MVLADWRLLRRYCILSGAVYLGSWVLGIVLALIFLPEKVVQQIAIHPEAQNAWFYISHNLEVELLFLAGALTLGIGTVILLIWNGCVDGVLATAVARHSGLPVVLASLLPHGFPEALAWILVGACSLFLSRRLRRVFFPGKSRSSSAPEPDARTQQTGPALQQFLLAHPLSSLALGATLLIILAGVVEATFSPWLLHFFLS